jgi:hypothetical protein
MTIMSWLLTLPRQKIGRKKGINDLCPQQSKIANAFFASRRSAIGVAQHRCRSRVPKRNTPGTKGECLSALSAASLSRNGWAFLWLQSREKSDCELASRANALDAGRDFSLSGNPREQDRKLASPYAALQALGQLAPVWWCHVIAIDRLVILTIPIPASTLRIFRGLSCSLVTSRR